MTQRIAFLRFIVVFTGWIALSVTARACPYCSAVSLTFAQEIKDSDAAAIVELTDLPPHPAGDDGAFAPGLGDPLSKSKFRVVEVLKGAEHMKNVKQIEAIYLGDSPVGTQFLVMGVDPKSLVWSTPIKLTPRARKYLEAILKLSDSGADRLAFFQDYLEDDDEVLRKDAYDEFGVAPYADVKALGPRMNHAQLIEWIKRPNLPSERRALYYTMLGACGTQQDLPMLEELLTSNDRKLKEGLGALIGCYLAIKGPDGIALIDDLFLKNKDAAFIDTHATIRSIRIAEESHIVTKPVAVAAFHLVLERPPMADLVIADLARWQDWTVIDKLVDLFVTSEPEAFIRLPVMTYLQQCPLPDAKQQLAKLEQLDPQTAKRAKASFLPLLGKGQSTGGVPASVNGSQPGNGANLPDAKAPQVGAPNKSVGAIPTVQSPNTTAKGK